MREWGSEREGEGEVKEKNKNKKKKKRNAAGLVLFYLKKKVFNR